MSLAGLSDDGRFVGLVSYAPTPALLLYDLVAGAPDTIDLGGVSPVLPPVVSPDGERVALFGLTQLNFTMTVVNLEDPPRVRTEPVGASRFTTPPIFGWPRWVGDRIYLAFLRPNDSGQDTLLVGSVSPDNPGDIMEEEYRAVLALEGEGQPELALGSASTYALTPDGQALVLGAHPTRTATHHSVYVMSPSSPRARLVRDAPPAFLVFPLFVTR
jgi:hypothetical protein